MLEKKTTILLYVLSKCFLPLWNCFLFFVSSFHFILHTLAFFVLVFVNCKISVLIFFFFPFSIFCSFHFCVRCLLLYTLKMSLLPVLWKLQIINNMLEYFSVFPKDNFFLPWHIKLNTQHIQPKHLRINGQFVNNFSKTSATFLEGFLTNECSQTILGVSILCDDDFPTEKFCGRLRNVTTWSTFEFSYKNFCWNFNQFWQIFFFFQNAILVQNPKNNRWNWKVLNLGGKFS